MPMSYRVKFCSCGRIRYIPCNVYDWMRENHKDREVIWICKNCGNIERIFLTPYEEGYAINSVDINEYAEPVECKIYASKGIEVYMKSGEIADTKQNGYFVNASECRAKENEGKYSSIADAKKSGADWASVDTQRLINTVKSMNDTIADGILHSISRHGGVKNICWKGTPYYIK